MEKRDIDYVLVPAGLLVMVGYHLWLLYRIKTQPNSTVIGINCINRRFWVAAMMEVTLLDCIILANVFIFGKWPGLTVFCNAGLIQKWRSCGADAPKQHNGVYPFSFDGDYAQLSHCCVDD